MSDFSCTARMNEAHEKTNLPATTHYFLHRVTPCNYYSLLLKERLASQEWPIKSICSLKMETRF